MLSASIAASARLRRALILFVLTHHTPSLIIHPPYCHLSILSLIRIFFFVVSLMVGYFEAGRRWFLDTQSPTLALSWSRSLTTASYVPHHHPRSALEATYKTQCVHDISDVHYQPLLVQPPRVVIDDDTHWVHLVISLPASFFFCSIFPNLSHRIVCACLSPGFPPTFSV